MLGVSCPDLKNITRLIEQQHTNCQNSLATKPGLGPQGLAKPSETRTPWGNLTCMGDPAIYSYSDFGESEEATFFLHLLSHVATPLFPAFRARFRNSPQTLPKVYRRSHFLQRGVVFGFLTIIWWRTIYIIAVYMVLRCNTLVLNTRKSRWCQILGLDFWVNTRTGRWDMCMSGIQTLSCRLLPRAISARPVSMLVMPACVCCFSCLIFGILALFSCFCCQCGFMCFFCLCWFFGSFLFSLFCSILWCWCFSVFFC